MNNFNPISYSLCVSVCACACACVCVCVLCHLDGQTVPGGLVEAARHAAVLGGVDECGGAQDVVQHVAGQRVALLTLEAQGQLQDLHQLCPVGQDLVPVHPGHLGGGEIVSVQLTQISYCLKGYCLFRRHLNCGYFC